MRVWEREREKERDWRREIEGERAQRYLEKKERERESKLRGKKSIRGKERFDLDCIKYYKLICSIILLLSPSNIY